MLWADKRALETNLKLSLLQIRERELNFYTNNCLAISTQSALLAGFAYAALMPGSSLGDAGGVAAQVYVVKLMYLACAGSARGRFGGGCASTSKAFRFCGRGADASFAQHAAQ